MSEQKRKEKSQGKKVQEKSNAPKGIGQGIPGGDNAKPVGPKFNVYWIYLLIIATILGLNFFYGSKKPMETNQREVIYHMLAQGDV